MNLAKQLREDANKVIQAHMSQREEEAKKSRALQEEAKKLARQYLNEDIKNCIKKCKVAAKSGSLAVTLHNEKEENLRGDADYHKLNEELVNCALSVKGIKIRCEYVKEEYVYDGPGSHGAYTYLRASW